MRHHAIGIIALLLLCGAVYFWIWPPEGVGRQLEAACWRGGALAIVLWLAFADVQRMPPWLFGLFLAMVVIVALKPRTAMLAVPVIIALAVLRPRFGRRQ
ncbi:MAG: hypothetical protein A2V70_08990 [Planctomycetes bacterium RBG_13_63_9]|nr:MAG: hypothetical protein A2V70_08990 [Planctomycetes bacterium RBG_13_63_9]